MDELSYKPYNLMEEEKKIDWDIELKMYSENIPNFEKALALIEEKIP